MTLDQFNKWLDKLENEWQNDSNILNDFDKAKIMDRVMQAIRDPGNENRFASEPELNLDEVLASFNLEEHNIPEVRGKPKVCCYI